MLVNVVNSQNESLRLAVELSTGDCWRMDFHRVRPVHSLFLRPSVSRSSEQPPKSGKNSHAQINVLFSNTEQEFIQRLCCTGNHLEQ